MRYLILVFGLLLLFCTTAQTQEPEEWTQDKFNDLVTFVYNHGEVITGTYGTLYSLTIVEDESLKAYLGFLPSDNTITLTIEAFTFEDNGNRVVDHNWYTHYFCEETGMYYPYPNEITGRLATLDSGGIVLGTINKITQKFKEEGYKKAEWFYWINRFYEFMLESKSKGVDI